MARPAFRRTIGLLGGSFNPAHAGHLHISVEAMKRLGLDEVWWLVSPGNPLKDPAEMADYAARMASARRVAQHPRIRLSDSEARHRTRYTIDSLRRLRRRHPDIRFVWLMGADNLAGFHRWKRWREIAALVDIAVFDRKPWTHAALRSKAAVALGAKRGLRSSGRLEGKYSDPYTVNSPSLSTPPPLLYRPPTEWRYVFMPLSRLSATELRKRLGNKAFLPHNIKE